MCKHPKSATCPKQLTKLRAAHLMARRCKYGKLKNYKLRSDGRICKKKYRRSKRTGLKTTRKVRVTSYKRSDGTHVRGYSRRK